MTAAAVMITVSTVEKAIGDLDEMLLVEQDLHACLYHANLPEELDQVALVARELPAGGALTTTRRLLAPFVTFRASGNGRRVAVADRLDHLPVVERREEAGPATGPASPLKDPRQKRSRPAGDGPAPCFWGGGAAMRYVAPRSVRPADERVIKTLSKVRQPFMGPLRGVRGGWSGIHSPSGQGSWPGQS
jgi:hypothetical protein